MHGIWIVDSVAGEHLVMVRPQIIFFLCATTSTYTSRILKSYNFVCVIFRCLFPIHNVAACIQASSVGTNALGEQQNEASSWWRGMSVDGTSSWRQCRLPDLATVGCNCWTVRHFSSSLDETSAFYFKHLQCRIFFSSHSLWTDPNDDHDSMTVPKELINRLSVFRNRLVSFGIQADPMFPKFCAQNQDECLWLERNTSPQLNK